MERISGSKVFVNCTLQRSSMNQHHVTAIISCKTGNMLSCASNTPLHHRSIHAEVAAIDAFQRKIKNRRLNPKEYRKGVCLVSLRFAPRGHLLLAKPCKSCSNCIERCPHIRTVMWSTADGGIFENKLCPECQPN